MPLLPVIASPTSSRPHQPLVVLQSSVSQTCLPVLRRFIQPTNPPSRTFLFCFLYPPSALTRDWSDTSDVHGSLQVFDWTERIPGYTVASDPREDVLTAVGSAPAGSIHVVIDSVDTLASDIGSDSQTYRLLKALLDMISSRTCPSVLVLHLLPCPLLAALVQTSFSPTLTHIVAHPPALVTHLATSYLTPPPPVGSPEKFWNVFIPISERALESQRLVYGFDGSGTSSGEGLYADESVVELVVRGWGSEGRKRGIERVIEGWRGNAPEDLHKLDCLKSIWPQKKTVDEKAPDPTQNLSFNLNLTPSQEKSRAQVPLPYVHEGKPSAFIS
ncbi:hypothetical protein F5I97DRAFT_1560138 [Phlebopus sp. FC_14]|nr:hypothetical protein F5I97DRAFT_1560138 [Phlebopus sp. FC_14]